MEASSARRSRGDDCWRLETGTKELCHVVREAYRAFSALGKPWKRPIDDLAHRARESAFDGIEPTEPVDAAVPVLIVAGHSS